MLVYIYDYPALDIDNFIKPIQDALIGLAFQDDSQITDAIIRRRHYEGIFDRSGLSSILLQGLDDGGEFVYVHIDDAPPQRRLV